MQVDPNNPNRGKDNNPSQQTNKDFYNNSVLKSNAIAELCNDLTVNETIEPNVEKV